MARFKNENRQGWENGFKGKTFILQNETSLYLKCSLKRKAPPLHNKHAYLELDPRNDAVFVAVTCAMFLYF